ncbi:MAG: YtxH domain-containing protein [bacterium]
MASVQNLERKIQPLVEDSSEIIGVVKHDLEVLRSGLAGLITMMKIGATVGSAIQAGILDRIVNFFSGNSKKPEIKQESPASKVDAFEEEIDMDGYDRTFSRTVSWYLGGLGIGLLLGAAAGVLFAPQSGKKTREMMGDKWDDLSSKLKGNIEDWTAVGKEKVQELKDSLKAQLD